MTGGIRESAKSLASATQSVGHGVGTVKRGINNRVIPYINTNISATRRALAEMGREAEETEHAGNGHTSGPLQDAHEGGGRSRAKRVAKAAARGAKAIKRGAKAARAAVTGIEVTRRAVGVVNWVRQSKTPPRPNDDDDDDDDERGNGDAKHGGGHTGGADGRGDGNGAVADVQV